MALPGLKGLDAKMLVIFNSVLDYDECQKKDACHANATCSNTIGSYTCQCKYSFTGDGRSCVWYRGMFRSPYVDNIVLSQNRYIKSVPKSGFQNWNSTDSFFANTIWRKLPSFLNLLSYSHQSPCMKSNKQ